jgi:hypothetical protein
LLLVAALAAFPLAESHSATGLFKSERTSGESKTCVYEVLGSPYTINVEAAQICPLTIEVPNPAPAPPAGSRQSQTGLLIRERVSGVSKICYYAVLGSEKTVTVSSVSLCPKSYQFQ